MRSATITTKPDISDISIRLTISALARELGIGRDMILKRLTAAGVQDAGKERGRQVYRLHDVIAAVFRGDAESIDDLSPKDRLDHYRAEREKLKLAEEEEQVVPVEDVRREYANVIKPLVQFLDTLIDHIERDIDLPERALGAMEARVDALRLKLYEQLSGET